MSSNLPPSGPPSGPPFGPPSGPPSGPAFGPPSGPPPSAPPPGWQDGSAEVLQAGRGGPLPPRTPATGRSGRRTGVIAGGALLGVGALAVGAWAGYSMMFATGAQPAEALPAATVGYVSVDLDPSGRQKLEALETLREFPVFADNVDLEAEDDLRLRLFEQIQGEGVCPGVDFAEDIDPWLGNRFGIAAIDLGDAEATAGTGVTGVGVVQVDDGAAAEDGLAALNACGGDGEEFGWSVVGDWAVVAETSAIAEQVTDAAAEAPLSDDEDFQRWTEEAGDPGILSAYAAPAAGDLLADAAGELGAFGLFGGFGDPFGTECLPPFGEDPFGEDPFGEDPFGEDPFGEDPFAEDSFTEDPFAACEPLGSAEPPAELVEALDGFEGAAMTIRFADGGLEIETATGAADSGSQESLSEAGGDAVSTLPADTAVALGIGLEAGWFDQIRESADSFLGEGGLDEALEVAELETGLDLPEDIETLLGESTAIALGGAADLTAFEESAPPPDLELGAKITGETDEVTDILDRLLATAQDPTADTLFSYDADGDAVVLGPSSDYRSELLQDGGLGDSDAYRDAVANPDDAGLVLFVNLDAGPWLDSLPGLDDEVRANLEPLRAIGLSGWVDDGVNHGSLRITTE